MQYFGIRVISKENPTSSEVDDWSKKNGIPEVFSSMGAAINKAQQYSKHSREFTSCTLFKPLEMDSKLAMRFLHQEKCACAQAIDTAIADSHYAMYNYNLRSAADKVHSAFGSECVTWVLANQLLNCDYDGRYSNVNKSWAQNTDIIPDKRVFCSAHPVLLNGFIDHIRSMIQELDTVSISSDEEPSVTKALLDAKKNLPPHKPERTNKENMEL